jgi:hypothetical protein
MLPLFATIAAMLTPFSIGHINQHNNVTHSYRVTHVGNHLAIALPPRTEITNESATKLLTITNVTTDNRHGRIPLHVRWTQDGTLERFGYNITFDGVRLCNFSSRWVYAYGYLER